MAGAGPGGGAATTTVRMRRSTRETSCFCASAFFFASSSCCCSSFSRCSFLFCLLRVADNQRVEPAQRAGGHGRSGAGRRGGDDDRTDEALHARDVLLLRVGVFLRVVELLLQLLLALLVSLLLFFQIVEPALQLVDFLLAQRELLRGILQLLLSAPFY